MLLWTRRILCSQTGWKCPQMEPQEALSLIIPPRAKQSNCQSTNSPRRCQASSGENERREALRFQQTTRNVAVQHEQTGPACDHAHRRQRKPLAAGHHRGAPHGPAVFRRTQSALSEEIPAPPHTPSLSWLPRSGKPAAHPPAGTTLTFS